MSKVKCGWEIKGRRELETAESGQLLFSPRRVFASCAQYSPQVKQLGAIQVQRHHGRSAYGSTPQNHDEVLAPCKVPLPTLTTRVEEWDNAPRLWISSASFLNGCERYHRFVYLRAVLFQPGGKVLRKLL